MSIDLALQVLHAFQGKSLTESLAEIEGSLVGLSINDVGRFCGDRGIDAGFMDSALAIKRVAGEINVIIHAAGILLALDGILEPGERVESASLGAGNTGRKFDLETTIRVAEFKFIDWRGGPETIRQDSIFKDFFELAEHQTTKRKFLYVVGTEHPLKFFRSGRALTSVLSRNPSILSRIAEKYGTSITNVRDYYAIKKDDVMICDVTPYIRRS